MSEEKLTFKKKFLFGLSAFPDQLTYQIFQFLIFTFYFTVVKIPLTLMIITYVIWGIWNAVNDPMLGALSERTKHRGKWGKRKLYLLISIIPLCAMVVLMFYVPFNTSDKMLEFIYFLTTIVIFEFFYTMFDVNVNAIFPEMFPNEKKRASANLFIKGLTVVALILSSLIPMIFISDYVPADAEIPLAKSEYFMMAIVVAVFTLIISIPFLLKGIVEKVEMTEDFEKRPSFFQSMKITLTNKTFVKFVVANTAVWYCFSILPMIIPIYAEFVIGGSLFEGGGSLIVGIALMLAFIIAALVMPIHKKLGFKYGMRKAFMITLVTWICTLFPFLFITGEAFQVAFVLLIALQGFPLSGALFYVDILHADVIDEDAVKFGVKRSASYYGINAFIHRISIILVILTIGFMFGNIGWDKQFDPLPSDEFLVILGLKAIMVIFPTIALVIGLLAMRSYGLHGERLEHIREDVKKIRA
ncbi:MAG: MFS transporter [Candidatus Lokiarchaeota archaeon]|nr:MFS transporter [Candidatus Lokiarchaeota archaeon]